MPTKIGNHLGRGSGPRQTGMILECGTMNVGQVQGRLNQGQSKDRLLKVKYFWAVHCARLIKPYF